MRFKPFHKLFFDAKDGAFSKVTNREHYDSQITLTDIEAEIVSNYFGFNNIHIGNVKSNRRKASKPFFLFGTNKIINLNLVFPKPNKPELRLYIADKKGKGFKPNAGMIWFLFVNQKDQLFIGAMDEMHWNNLDQIDSQDEQYSVDIEESIPDLDQVQSISGSIVQRKVGERIVYVRNPKLAILRFKLANFQCEIDSSHRTFTSLKTNLPFVEAHHFIPMKFQAYFDEPLDNLENIIALCPTCHRAFHHAVKNEKLALISRIYEDRASINNNYSLEEIAGFYNCFTID